MQISSSYAHNNYLNPYAKANETSTNPQEDTTKVVSLNKDEDKHVAQNGKKEETKEAKGQKSEEELTQEEKQQVSELQARDTEVRAHEAAHLAAAGGLAAGGASFTYQKGPDGKQYAIGGEVPIDTSEGSTPQETVTRARQIKAAATAPANPSGQDMKIASTAAMMEMKALMEISSEKMEENSTKNGNNPYQTSQNEEQNSPLDLTA